MEPMNPAYPTGVMLLIAAGAVVLLLFLIIKVKLHPFITLVLVSVLTALAVQVPITDIPDVLLYGFSGTLASVALLVAFGVMLGRILEVSGGAQTLADALIKRFGEHRAPFALGVASLLFGFPIFFDAALVVFLPIILVVARRFGGSLMYYLLPAAGAFSIMHAVVPPHPGPVAAANFLGANIGYTMLLGIPVAAVSWYFGAYLFSRWVSPRLFQSLPTFEKDEADAVGAVGADHTQPSFSLVFGLLLLPIVLIGLRAVTSMLESAGLINDHATWVAFVSLIGQTYIALLIAVLAAIATLGTRGRSMANVEKLLNDCLGPICPIILITGAGGMFGGVLLISGIGESLTTSLNALGLSLIYAAFLIAAALRVAQGSATVALVTTSAIIAAAVEAASGLNQLELVALVFAIAGGATVLSHVNDSGFWLVSKLFDLDEVTTLKTWTVMTTLLGLGAFTMSLFIWYLF